MICPKCNAELPDGMKFCTNCGSNMQEAVAQPVAQPTQQPVQQPAAVPPVQPMNPQGGYVQQAPQTPVQPMNPQGGYVQQAPQTPVQPMNPQGGYAPQAPQTPVQPMNTQGGYVPPQPVQPIYPQGGYVPPMQQAPQGYTTEPKKKSKKLIIIIAIIVAVLLIAGGIIAAILMGNKDKNKNNDKSSSGVQDVPGTGQVIQPDEPDEPSIPDTPSTPDEPSVPDEPSEPDVPDVPVVPDEPQIAEKTIMLYIVGSDLETKDNAAAYDFTEMVAASYSDDVKLVMQTGGCRDWYFDEMKDGEVQRYEIRNGKIEWLEDLGIQNMIDENTLSDFIQYSAANYPAEDYILVLWDHGGGVPIGFGKDENFPGDMMYDFELHNALSKGGVMFETIVFDCCNMCTLEVAMAIKDYAKYMVAAESYVAGIGLYYTSWLSDVVNGADALDYCETIVSDYMDSLKPYKAVGSMSIIKLNKVDAIYTAYEAYLNSVHQDLLNGYFAEYAGARASCGLYQGTDSVDLITLASTYENQYSSQLINAVVNAVSYTDSDFVYGHGLAAYSPGEYYFAYDWGRVSLEMLSYSELILGCYDTYASLALAYQGTDFVNDYAGSWYNSSVVEAYVPENTQAEKTKIETSIVDDKEVIEVSEESWRTISSVNVGLILVYEDDEQAVMLGDDFYTARDDYGNILVDKPEAWVAINGMFACYIAVDSYTDYSSGEWSQLGGIPAYKNGEEILMIIYYDNEYPSGTILGYIPYDFETGDSDESTYYMFKDDDVIELVLPFMNYNTDSDFSYAGIGETFYAKDMYVDYLPIDLEGQQVLTYFTIYDIYGNIYETDSILLD